MKLSLKLDDVSKTTQFGPGDPVRGTLEIYGCGSKVPRRVTATLQGRVKVRIWPLNGNGFPEQSEYTLFEQTKELDCMKIVLPVNKIIQNIYSCPFEFQFPSTGCPCADTDPCLLPPSMNICDTGVRIRAIYSISITVERQVLKIPKNRHVTQELPFSRDPQITPLPASVIASLPARKLCPNYQDSRSRATDPMCRGWLPSYSPALQIELMLPEPPMLLQGRETSVRLVVHAPPEILTTGEVYVRSVNIDLQTTVTATLSFSSRRVVQTRSGCSITGAVNVDSDHLEMDLGAWGSFVVLGLWPTYVSRMLEVSHCIRATAGLSQGLGSTIQYVEASLDVLVMDPPPAYEVTESLPG
ncbi:hypothetical protein IWW34DRAFT_766358 [Fusarium oxysporum f. sp. albedinis]|nr:hypothetical protein IWW34DRAFT_766358 [Fusarium oxysporum f. sp. albedinis]